LDPSYDIDSGGMLSGYFGLYFTQLHFATNMLLWARYPSCHPTNSIKALKANKITEPEQEKSHLMQRKINNIIIRPQASYKNTIIINIRHLGFKINVS